MEPLKPTLAGIYIALCTALGGEVAARANEMLRAFADDDFTPDNEADIYRALVGSTTNLWCDGLGRLRAPPLF